MCEGDEDRDYVYMGTVPETSTTESSKRVLKPYLTQMAPGEQTKADQDVEMAPYSYIPFPSLQVRSCTQLA